MFYVNPMDTARENLLTEMFRVFPPRPISGRAAPHECPECEEICAELRERTWNDVPRSFIAENCDVLPLLSEQAYVAFLPAWLREGLLEPDGGVAGLLLVNLSSAPPVGLFTQEQASLIVLIVEKMVELSVWGSNDPVSVEHLAGIRQMWSPVEGC